MSKTHPVASIYSLVPIWAGFCGLDWSPGAILMFINLCRQHHYSTMFWQEHLFQAYCYDEAAHLDKEMWPANQVQPDGYLQYLTYS